jgi:hypothetical protein
MLNWVGINMRLLFGFLIVFLAGCVSSTRMQESEKARIRSVSINPVVKMPDDPTFIGTFWGILGSDKSQLKEHMQKVNFDLPRIVKQQFKAQAERQAFFEGKLKDTGDYKFDFEVKVYGLIVGNTLVSGDCTGLLTVVARMYDPSGKVVWEKMDHADRDKLPSYNCHNDDFLKGDAALNTSFGKAAELVSTDLINDFLGK